MDGPSGQACLALLAPRVRRDAAIDTLVEALYSAQAAWEDETLAAMPDELFPQAFRSAMRLIAEELACRDDEGQAALVDVLRADPEWPLGYEAAAAGWALEPEDARALIEFYAEQFGPEEPEQAAALAVLDAGDGAADAFTLPADATFALALHRLRLDLAVRVGDPAAARAVLAELLDDEGLSALKETVLGLFTEAAGLQVTTAEEAGASRIGGWPDVPAEWDWPLSESGAPLSLLAQLQLSELPLADLPAHGMLYFFYDAATQPWHSEDAPGAWQVRFHPAESGLAPRDPAPALSLPALSVVPVRFLAPDLHAWWLALDLASDQPGWREVQALVETVAAATPDVAHQVGGDRPPLQDAHPNDGLEDWGERYRLLLDLGPLRRLGLTWGDMGRLSFWVRQTDLARADFSDVLGILESH